MSCGHTASGWQSLHSGRLAPGSTQATGSAVRCDQQPRAVSQGAGAAPGQDRHVGGAPGCPALRTIGPEPGSCPGRLCPLPCSGSALTPSHATALLQGKKQWVHFKRPGHATPVPSPSHPLPTHHPSLPLQPHDDHSVQQLLQPPPQMPFG